MDQVPSAHMNTKSVLAALAVPIFLALPGCTTYGPVEGQELARSHVVSVGVDGNLYEIPQEGLQIDSKSGDLRVRGCNDIHDEDCQLSEQRRVEDSYFRQVLWGIRRYFENADWDSSECQKYRRSQIREGKLPEDFRVNPETRQIVVYVHGGLNTRAGSLKQAISRTRKIKCEGIYPIFVQWRSSASSTLYDSYTRIRDGEIRTPWSAITAPLYFVNSVVSSLGNAPVAWTKEISNAASSVALPGLIDFDVGEYRPLRKASLRDDLGSVQGDLNVKILNPDAKADIGKAILWWSTALIKPFTTPFVYTIGKSAWDQMQRRVDTQIIRQDAFLDGKSTFEATSSLMGPNVVSWEGLPADCAAAPDPERPSQAGATLKFLCRFQSWMFEQAEKDQYQVTLVGHSMGAMIVNRALEYLPDFPVNNLVYMGSADTLASFLSRTVGFVRHKKQVHDITVNVYNLHLHPESEDRESTAFGIGPSGSLLVWIDGMFEQPDYILHRTAGRWTNMWQMIELLKNISEEDGTSDQFHFKIFDACPKRREECTSPQRHGDLDERTFWRESYWY